MRGERDRLQKRFDDEVSRDAQDMADKHRTEYEFYDDQQAVSEQKGEIRS